MTPFEAGWDSIVKMPFVPGSVREMTAEDSERWGFPEGTEITQPNNPERYLPRPKLIGDFINEETGKLLPIIIQQGLKANPEAVEREKGMRRVFGDGLRDSRTTTAHIPLDPGNRQRCPPGNAAHIQLWDWDGHMRARSGR